MRLGFPLIQTLDPPLCVLSLGIGPRYQSSSRPADSFANEFARRCKLAHTPGELALGFGGAHTRLLQSLIEGVLYQSARVVQDIHNHGFRKRL